MSTHAGMLRDTPAPPAAISIEKTHRAHEMRWKSEQVGQFGTIEDTSGDFCYGSYFPRRTLGGQPQRANHPYSPRLLGLSPCL